MLNPSLPKRGLLGAVVPPQNTESQPPAQRCTLLAQSLMQSVWSLGWQLAKAPRVALRGLSCRNSKKSEIQTLLRLFRAG